MSREFTPWRSDFVVGIIFTLFGGWLTYLNLSAYIDNTESTNRLLFSAIGAMIAWLGLSMIPSGFNRINGVRIEAKAMRKLSLPAGWDLERSVETPFGDCDALITDPLGKRFVVEVKAYEGLKRNWFGRVVKLKTGKKPDQDPVEQVLRNLKYFNAQQAIIWCPKSTEQSITKLDKVLLVNGDHRTLKRAIKADLWGSFTRKVTRQGSKPEQGPQA